MGAGIRVGLPFGRKPDASIAQSLANAERNAMDAMAKLDSARASGNQENIKKYKNQMRAYLYIARQIRKAYAL